MAHELLGASFDIHAGGIDLQFPHHENEIAQSACAHPEGGFANVWMHNEMLQVEGKKMSKSLGNFFTVRDLLEQGVPGEVIRFVMLSTHYGKPMDWTEKKRAEAEATLRKWYQTIDVAAETDEISEAFLSAISNDLNTPMAISVMQELYSSGRFDLLRNAIRMLGLLVNAIPEWADRHNEIIDGVTSIHRLNESIAVRQRVRKLAQCWRNLRLQKDWPGADALKSRAAKAGLFFSVDRDGVNADAMDFDITKLEGLDQ